MGLASLDPSYQIPIGEKEGAVTVLTRPAGAAGADMISLAGLELELIDRGRGTPLLYLHGGAGIGCRSAVP